MRATASRAKESDPPRLERRPRALAATFGVAIGAVALTLTYFRVAPHAPFFTARVPWAEQAAALSQMRIGWFAAFLGVNLLSIPLRAMQLAALTERRRGGAPRLFACVRAVAVGILANNLLPVRLGEAARALVLVRDGEVALPRTVNALIVGRAFDLGALLLVAFAVPIFFHLPAAHLPALHALAAGASIFGALFFVILVVLRFSKRSIEGALGRLSPRAELIAREFSDGFDAVTDGRRLFVAVFASLAVPLALAAANGCALYALHLDVPTGAALTLTGLVLLGVAVPGAPSSLGVYHAIVVATLSALGAPKTEALVFALATHLVGTVANCAVGAFALGSTQPLPRAAEEPLAEARARRSA